MQNPSAPPSTLDPWGENAQLELVSELIQRTAPAEQPLLAVLWPHYRARKRRYRDRPGRLTAQRGGTAGGAGGLGEVALLLPYVMVVVTAAFDLLRGVAEEQVSNAVTAWLRGRKDRRPASLGSAALPLTRAQLLRLEALVARDVRKWDLNEEQRSTLVYELRAALIARFGIAEEQDNGPTGD